MQIQFLLLCLLPSYAMAEPVAAISGDFDGDGTPDRAELTLSPNDEGMADLMIYSGSNTEPLTIAHEIVWVGGIGQQPELAITEHGSL